MKNILMAISVFALNGCAAFTPISNDLEKVLNYDAITIKCDKDAIQPRTDIFIEVKVINKEEVVPPFRS